jgi:hypothetical protein
MFISYARRMRDWLHHTANEFKKARKASHETHNSAIQANNPAPVLRAELQIPDSAIDKIKTKTAEEKSSDGWKIRLEAGTLAIVLAYTIVATFQWLEINTQNINQSTANNNAAIAAERTLRQSQEALRIDERAWLGAAEPTLQRFDQNGNFQALIPLINSGKTPAIQVESGIKQGILPTR